ncbi:recombinase family protein [Nonomuraea endophytica]|uniref:DNA invertase Pin-like site-specific DNA recombinase n=1 Tax=Nonomuraea endophytica TaxID=714136 RepID=A0A7W8ACA4_9ACTN|nr:recombinase family protein [Nonomuraea endophytica]MBB5082999.1 DNA invertase Pin-like site-specific DNA recombinase [Nonomuraea endophytica]
MTLAAAFTRVSTGSQDEASQIQAIEAHAQEHGITIVKTFRLRGYSASAGTQEPALRDAIADIQRGEYTTLIVTESSRLDRREDLDVQAEILLAIRAAGGDVVAIAEPEFGRTDFAGRIVTLVAQHANAEKSREVKDTTYRGIMMVRDNRAHHGPLPMFWATKGKRYSRQAYCKDPEAVNDILRRVADGESIASVGRAYGIWAETIKAVLRFAAAHTGVIECSYRHRGVTETWQHTVTPVVDSALWWRANKVLDANKTQARVNVGGRPVARPADWISGVLDCPECDGKLYINAGKLPSGNRRTPKLRCNGKRKQRLACGRFKGCEAQPITSLVEAMFASDTTEILAFQRVAGNAHELDALNASLSKVQARLSVTDDDDELDAMIAERKEIKARIRGFVVVPDSFDYAPTGQTVAQMWSDGDDTVKRGMVLAAKQAWGLTLAHHEGRWEIDLAPVTTESGEDTRIVDLGDGLCFRR